MMFNKFLASSLFGVLVTTIVMTLKTTPNESIWLSPAIYVTVLASTFMGVFLEILRPSK